jgi:2-dehydropantoate 2-reductase
VIEQRILVVGAGAIGGVIAAMMHGSVRRVAVLGSDRPATDLLRDPGLELERGATLRRVPLEAHRSVNALDGDFDFCLLAVKASALDQVLPVLAQRGGIDTFVSLGNGLVQDRIAAFVGEERLIAATVEWGSTNIGDGRVRQTSNSPTVLGELDGSVRPRTEALASALATVGEVRVTSNMRGQLWSKLILNSALSGMSVVGGCECSRVLNDSEGRVALRRLWAEGYELGLTQQLTLEPILGMPAGAVASPDPAVHGPGLDVLLEKSGPTRASMLQDIERGRLTEVDVINGAVVARAHALGARAPGNERVLELVHSFERGERKPSTELFAAVAAGL